ncbi:regulatory protein [Bordetella trematum]|uniref:PhaM family polyhydroxyalkanoate granule multifunctional regulatory protein n=1 Tax=Bordetella trematum TaxID=123899 RepID=UPI00052F1948|nr:PhaM family polyhydroxyalkanoate granule multifunctional regulatory protein [Bordetella trematum]QIM70716.1 transcriptional regulator [Bordetella trematum]CZZ90870.1 regulatory protein [Bordetella trematum]
MTHSNPFVLPGLGQDADLSGNPLLASMEMMRQAWSGLAGSGGLGQSLPLTPPLNPEDLERRIAELRTVEGWLRMNLQMLSSTIQGLEVQRATIATLRSFVSSVPGMPQAADGAPSPLEVALGLKPAPAQSTTAPSEPSESPAETVNAAAQSASQAWWDMLNQQFSNLAAATAASLPTMEAMAKAAEQSMQAGAPASEPAPAASAKPAAKPAAKRASAPRAAKKTSTARASKSSRAS